MQGFSMDGYFQEYVVVDYRSAMVLPAELDPKIAAPLFCAGVTAYNGVYDCELKPGQWMAVIGCGGLGHLVSELVKDVLASLTQRQGIQYAKAMELKVIGIDISDTQLDVAKKAGADYVFNSMTDKDYVKKILEITGGGVDAAVNFTAAKRVGL
jgi:alcohol dehydrogenase, propanol-preferring